MIHQGGLEMLPPERRKRSRAISRIINLARDQEINELVVQFNRMASNLEELEELRTEFVSMLSHDLKSPLAIVKMHAEAIGAHGGANPRSLQAITRSADRMLRLVGNFLDASRADSGRLELALRPVQPDAVIRRVQEDGKVLAQSRGLRIVADLPDELPQVLADAVEPGTLARWERGEREPKGEHLRRMSSVHRNAPWQIRSDKETKRGG